ncbi:MAG TPA: fumarylacetoacetate hydrolase [Rhodobacteraceae bacterium]|jgi:2-keto-4-pentenoate hydratase/2-oxohepta-3-ene-1,7-dioic acid hydratase in catechol pathway|nr:fumarylacetoacetate hydrolase family protein [Paracoccaceae bacterium]HBR62232.1 fumarylacetoacetate hydrolase [Paracoccaceae bacterium]|tara:strand:- start:1993 stop:2838 length:846 start_codon:yes stop_codon:yes gene_type:complete
MKLATIRHRDQTLYGQVSGDWFYPAEAALKTRYTTLKDLITDGALTQLAAQQTRQEDGINLAHVSYLPPIPDPGKIICVGLNYRKPYPVDGVAPPNPSQIILFGKERDTLLGHQQKLETPAGPAAHSFDFEGEIAVIIGTGGRHITADDAMTHVLGYSIFNDGSVRDWQKHSIYAGKNFSGSGSWGPWITTADEIKNPATMSLTTHLNGQQMQNTTADQMIYSIAAQISYASHLYELQPGDIIATGSPDGTGGSRTPKRYLQEGDLLEIAVSGIGLLQNNI